jgi:transcriptional regulator with XRE-family HTH domain
MQQTRTSTASQAQATLTKAVLRAAVLLRIKQSLLADILGISPATVSRLHAGRYLLDPHRAKEWELALLFVRLFRSLDAIVGHGPEAQTWLQSENLGLGARPAELIRSTEGLVRVVHYLDAYRGRL